MYTCHVTVATEDGEKEAEMLAKFRDFQSKSEMYYVYHAIQRYTVSTCTTGIAVSVMAMVSAPGE